MEYNSNIQILIGEVLPPVTTNPDGDVNSYDFKWKNAIYVSPYGQETPTKILCYPYNVNIEQIPIPGEHVLIIGGIGSKADVGAPDHTWYYFSPYSLQSNINNNALRGISIPQTGDHTRPATNSIEDYTELRAIGFTPKYINKMQPYIGDILINGRWGNNIRLGNTIQDDIELYNLRPNYKGAAGDPIIILSNTLTDPGDKKKENYVVEDIKKDGASLYLTSTQNFPNFTLSKPLGNYGSKSESEYNSPQLIGSADRIILQAKKDIIALDAKTRVTINTPELKIGDESACEAMVHGDVLMSILVDILNVISAGSIGTAGITTLPLDKGALANAFKQLQYLNSSKYFIKRDS